MTTNNSRNIMPAALGRVFSFPVFLGALLVAGVFLNLCVRLKNDATLPAGHWHITFLEGDTFWHIAAGQRILATRSWPTTNHYSFTAPNSQWLDYQWLGEVLMAGASRLGGARALLALLWFLGSAIFLLLYYCAYLRSGNVKAALAGCAAVWPLLGVCFTLRPQLLGYIFLLATLILLERYRQGLQKSLWLLPCIFVLWVNTHGTFSFGLLAIGVYWAAGLKDFRLGDVESGRACPPADGHPETVKTIPLLGKEGSGVVAGRRGNYPPPLAPPPAEEGSHFQRRLWTQGQRRHLGLVLLFCSLATLVNPYGPRLLYGLAEPVSQPLVMAYVDEWQPLNFKELYAKWFLIVLFLFFLAPIIWRVRWRLEELALVLIAAYMACLHQRIVVFFAILVAPALAALLAKWWSGYDKAKDKPLLNALLISLFAAGLVEFFPSAASLQQVIDLNQPRRAVDFLRQHPLPGPMFNDQFWGGYLIWAFGGRHPVFIDGRSDAYEPSGVLREYIGIMRADSGSLTLLDKCRVQSCLIERGGALCALLESRPEWKLVYQDDLSVLLVQNAAGP